MKSSFAFLPGSNRKSSLRVAIVSTSVTFGGIILAIAILCLLRLKLLAKREYEMQPLSAADSIGISSMSSRYDFDTIKVITNDFACEIGSGEFGCVYKGKLPTGKEVAVKRLSETSQQGVEQFINEVEILLKLQHQNLVRLLGYCCEATKKLLVHEFVPNKSLNLFIFGRDHPNLDWPTRFKILKGIARGMQLYLHEDSCVKIINKDLKASNILLDSDMNPKISDFGLARIFPCDQSVRRTDGKAGTCSLKPPNKGLNSS
ncbi:unnamed protein product [Cuscuta campestris]|uniref:non-specific serine/threonine protein kinase n=1 Tax=Cuscuta campestris TaxID=132261 RepID=A0A484KP80_9ASTE|nr:unnamed protein product [Cuscuta campestris]